MLGFSALNSFLKIGIESGAKKLIEFVTPKRNSPKKEPRRRKRGGSRAHTEWSAWLKFISWALLYIIFILLIIAAVIALFVLIVLAAESDGDGCGDFFYFGGTTSSSSSSYGGSGSGQYSFSESCSAIFDDLRD
ncbi:hypothetical protein niasHT_004471 [Heterodera trifolii]|uniref:Uncharacterized protein n=1 Tax=Heterodera trifolii TaxID=157864 RepID=A0ABD2MDA6_9BILA